MRYEPQDMRLANKLFIVSVLMEKKQQVWDDLIIRRLKNLIELLFKTLQK